MASKFPLHPRGSDSWYCNNPKCDVPKAVREVLKSPKYIHRKPYDINCGDCDDFARDVREHMGGPGDMMTINGPDHEDTPSHAFLSHGGKHYDAETPEGVKNWRDLPALKSYYRRLRGNESADSLIIARLALEEAWIETLELDESAAPGDDKVWLQPRNQDLIRRLEKTHGTNQDYVQHHSFLIVHPVHGPVGNLNGTLHQDGRFDVSWLDLARHPLKRNTDPMQMNGTPDEPKVSHTFIRSTLKSLNNHVPGIKSLSGTRVTGIRLKYRPVHGREMTLVAPKAIQRYSHGSR